MDTTLNKRVLVVDDDPVITDMMLRRLMSDGYAAVGVCDAQAARKTLADGASTGTGNQSMDMVLPDIDMPKISGLDLLREIRQKWSAIDIPVIMVTGRDGTEDLVQALNQGANDYVTKPVDFPVLLARIRTHTAMKDLHAQLKNSHRSLIHAAKM